MSSICLTREDLEYIVELSGGCSLDVSPGTNWIQQQGGLPEYICKIARAIRRGGTSTSRAIAIAVSRCRAWSADPTKSADTRAKAASAIAEWEKKKSASHAKKNGKDLVKATVSNDAIINLSIVNYPTEMIRRAWNRQSSETAKAYRSKNPNATYSEISQEVPYSYLKEIWSNFIIVSMDNDELFKIPFVVDKDLNVTFGPHEAVKVDYVADDSLGSELSDDDIESSVAMMSAVGDVVSCACAGSKVRKIMNATDSCPSALDRIMNLTADK